MVSTFTPNIQLQEPATGDQVGTWGTLTVNPNMTVLDLTIGGISSVGLNNSNIILSAAQFQAKGITANSTLTGSVTLTFPTSFTKSYEFYNACTGSSAFIITLATTAAGGEVICAPPGEWFEFVNDGTNIRFKNFGRIGEYVDYIGSSMPNWNDGCTKPPYLNCIGQTISSATYPVLTGMIGTTLPDSRGRGRFALDQGQARLSAVLTSSTVGAAGGAQQIQLGTSNLPAYTPSGSVSLNSGLSFVGANQLLTTFSNNAGGANIWVAFPSGTTTSVGGAAFSGNSQGGTAALFSNVPPAYIGGLTMVRAG